MSKTEESDKALNKCPRCKERLFKNGDNVHKCLICGYEDYSEYKLWKRTERKEDRWIS
jgi:Zn ribbon nucleic-acid-binding protein